MLCIFLRVLFEGALERVEGFGHFALACPLVPAAQQFESLQADVGGDAHGVSLVLFDVGLFGEDLGGNNATSMILFSSPNSLRTVGAAGSWRHMPSTMNLYWCGPSLKASRMQK